MGKVTVRMAPRQPAPLPGDSAYPVSGAVLITGGLGALGALVATWLANRSAALRLVLVGRTGRLPFGAEPGPLQELVSGRVGGSMVTLCMGDVASAADATAACLKDDGGQPPLQARHGCQSFGAMDEAVRECDCMSIWLRTDGGL